MTARHHATPRPTAVDHFLICVYLIGIYLGIAARLPGGIPLPAVIAGVAGLAMVAKHVARISAAEAACLVAILTVAMLSILAAPDFSLLGERFKGVIQFGYSIVISYGLYLSCRSVSAAWLGRFCLIMCIAILAAGMLENALPAVREISDAFRATVFESGVYSADIRDLTLYGRVRPKVFTSEPSFATFGFTLFAFVWYVLSSARAKTIEFVALLALGYVVLRGPTIVLGLLLIPVYQGLLASRHGNPEAHRIDWPRALLALALAGTVTAAGLLAGTVLFEERLAAIASGRDASVFARVIAPPLVAVQILLQHPVAGTGLAGWEYIENTVQQIYASSNWLATDIRFESAAHAITNWFWLHWIFLGALFGVLMIVVLTLLLRAMGVHDVLFCWIVWSVFGQAAGSYVGPRTWTVLVIAGLVSLIHERDATARRGAAASGSQLVAIAPSARSGVAARFR